MKSQRYAVITSRTRSVTRLGWKSPSTAETFCGICMRGVISPELGAVCSSCGGEVLRTFEVFDGGQPLRPAQRSASPTAFSVEQPGWAVSS
ncbi:hypothetical protein [Acidobacterium sp. S8]|uniref:hypothetical protein n=1 Tax=Acidobacterium sp. S8 TaxID=1641854 RepID=UPI00131AE00B|nr:hypothetical protein [Acidobacterium sp. S8]